jgi:hypothetical protein
MVIFARLILKIKIMEQKRIGKNGKGMSTIINLLNKPEKYFRENINMFFVVALLLPSGFVYSQHRTTEIPKLRHEDVEVITEAYHLWKTKGDKVWEGWSEIKMPFIYKKEHYEYWIDFPVTANDVGQFVEKINGLDVYGQAISGQNGFAASMDVNNVQAVVLSSPKITGMTKEEWIIAAIHEMFHVYQGAEIDRKKINDLEIGYGKDASWMLNYPFPYGDTSLNTISHMQGYLSFNIYRSDSFRDNMYDCFLLKDVLTLYKNYIIGRYGNENDYKYSVFQQSIEGVAKYTEIKMAEIAGTDYVPLNQDIHFTDVYTNQINVVRHCGKGTGGRLTFYYLGLGMCLVLDKIAPDWKNSYFSAAWLDEIFNTSLKQIIEKQKGVN